MPTPRFYQIRPGTAGHWCIFTDVGDPVFSDRDYRVPQDALRDLKDLALARGMSMNTTMRPDKSVDVEFVPGFSTQLTINLPPGAAKAVDQVLKETGDTPGEMFAKALGLYLLALKARKEGKVVGSADSPDSLDTEFTGF